MDINSFKNILAHFPENSSEEVHDILSLKKQFPYSQVLHALAAKLSRDHNLTSQNRELELAAVYATDRGVLKEVMDAEPESHTNQLDQASVSETYQTESFTSQTIHYSTNTNLADEVLRDLERLNELRHNFEAMYVNVETPPHTPPVTAVSETKSSDIAEHTETKTKKTAARKKPEDKKDLSGLTKKERIIALAKESDTLAQVQALKKNEPNRKKKSSSDSGEGLIEEIVSSKEEINPESEKQKEQIEIIDQFIKAQPSLVNRDRTNSASLSDLTAIKSGEFGDNIVSETLVDILIRQGKKDKAIEVLKKLIWKFPQKKAYFAAQIEELKK